MGVGVILSSALQRLGVESRVLSSCAHPFGFEADFLLPYRSPFTPWRRQDWRYYYKFNILHNHDNNPLPHYVQSQWRGALVQHYHDPKTNYPINQESVLSLASLPNILKVIPSAHWLPIPVETEFFSPQHRAVHEGVRIGYNAQRTDPTKASFIPTLEIQDGIRRSGGRAIPYPLKEVCSHKQMLEYYAQIDIWVDRIGHCFYGFSALEAASMGIPIITQIGSFEEQFVPDCPFLSVEREGVAAAIAELSQDQAARALLGKQSREFVVRRHDAQLIAKKCLQHYQKILGGG